MKINLLSIFIFIISVNYSFADFKKVKKKAEVNNPEIIFPVSKNTDKCIGKMYANPATNLVKPILEVKAPSGYGLDNRFFALVF